MPEPLCPPVLETHLPGAGAGPGTHSGLCKHSGGSWSDEITDISSGMRGRDHSSVPGSRIKATTRVSSPRKAKQSGAIWGQGAENIRLRKRETWVPSPAVRVVVHKRPPGAEAESGRTGAVWREPETPFWGVDSLLGRLLSLLPELTHAWGAGEHLCPGVKMKRCNANFTT